MNENLGVGLFGVGMLLVVCVFGYFSGIFVRGRKHELLGFLMFLPWLHFANL